MSKIFYTNIDLKKNQLENAKIHHLTTITPNVSGYIEPVVGQLGEFDNRLYMGVPNGNEGTKWEMIAFSSEAGVTSFGGQTGNITVGLGLKMNDTNPNTVQTKLSGDVTNGIGMAYDGNGAVKVAVTPATDQATNGNVITGSAVDTKITTAIEALDGSHDVVEGTTLTPSGTDVAGYKLEFKDGTETNGILGTGSVTDTIYLTGQSTAQNPIVLKSDIASIVGALVYRGSCTAPSSGTAWTTSPSASTVAKGDVYVCSANATVATGTTLIGVSVPAGSYEAGDMFIYNGTDWNIISGENQTEDSHPTIVAGANDCSTIGTVDGTALTAKVSVTGGNATIASVSDGVVTLKAGVTQTGTTGTIANNSSSNITLAKVATTGAAADVSYSNTTSHLTATTVQAAIDEVAGTSADAVKDVKFGSTALKNTDKEVVVTAGGGITLGGNATSGGTITANVNGYIVNNAGTNNNAIDIDSSKVDSAYTTANTTNLATVATVTAALDGLNVTEYAQGSVSNNVISIASIKEVDGKIAAGDTPFTVTAERGLSLSTSGSNATIGHSNTAVTALSTEALHKIAYDTYGHITGSTAVVKADITTLLNLQAVSATDLFTVADITTSGETGKTVTTKTYAQTTDGQSTIGTGTKTFTVGNGALKLSGYGATVPASDPNPASIPVVSATGVFGANDTADSTLALSNAFVLDATYKTIGLRTNQAVSASNNIATMNDIASLSGAMHYMGGVTAYPTPTTTTKAGDTYIVTQRFEYPANSGTIYEVGDMLVANADGTSATYNVVQSNLTLGVNQGQVAPNSAALTSGNIVVASGTGIETSSYTVANLASQATTVASTTGGVTITDTLTVGGTAQTEQTVTLVSANNAIAVSNSDNTITLTHITPSNFTAPSDAAVKITTDAYGHITATSALVAGDINFDVTGTGITPTGGSGSTATVQEAITQLDSRITSSTAIFHVDSQAVSTATSGMYVWTLTITAASGFNAKNDATVSVRDNSGNEVECDKTLSGTTITLKFSEAITAGEFTAVVVAKNTATNVQ